MFLLASLICNLFQSKPCELAVWPGIFNRVLSLIDTHGEDELAHSSPSDVTSNPSAKINDRTFDFPND